MYRRRFLTGAAAAAVGLIAPETSRNQSNTYPRLAVSYDDPGQAIALDFVGLSYESAILAGGDYFTPDNASALGLIRLLGENGVIRIGGNTSERAVWGADAKSVGPARFVITPANIDKLAVALRVLGWKLIYGLNLARGSPAEVADEAAYVANAVGVNLLAFQIGNEPDGFGRWTGVRTTSYDFSAYLAEWRTFHAAIRARTPGAPFAGPDVSSATDWIAAFAQAMPEGLVLLTHHYYADGPSGAPHVSLPKLLRSSRQFSPLLERLAQYSRRFRLPFRIVETNSIYDEGQRGVSDTLGAALWGLELMFQAAAAGAAGINFHGGIHNRRASDDKAYTPIGRSADRYRAMPLYYGMLMFAQSASGMLVPAHLAEDTSSLKAFAVRAPEGTLRVCLINRDVARDERVAIDPGRKFTVASTLRLAGPAIGATAGVTVGGASVDHFGIWAPLMSEEVRLTGHELIVDVPVANGISDNARRAAARRRCCKSVYARVAQLTGLPEDVVARTRGFIGDAYVKNLRLSQHKIVSHYDATFAADDPYPESPGVRGPDPQLDGLVRAYGGAFVGYARDELSFKTEMTYNLLNSEISDKWDWHDGSGRTLPSVNDDLRELFALTPSFRLMIAHGYSDMVTPYAVSRYVLDHLPPSIEEERAELRLYRGGHMFYIDPLSRNAFTANADTMYAAMTDQRRPSRSGEP